MDKTKAMIVLALAILLLGTGTALASSSDDETTAAPPPDGGNGIVDMIAGLCDTGWEAGLSLELDASTAFELLKDVLMDIPPELTEALELNDLLEYFIANPDMTFEEFLNIFILSTDSDDIESADTNMYGHLVGYSDCIDTGNGYDITFTLAGEMTAEFDFDLTARDPAHPDVVLYDDVTSTYSLDAEVMVHMTYDMVPTAMDVGFSLSLDGLSGANYESYYDDETDTIAYRYVDDYSYTSNVYWNGGLHAGISGLTADEVMSILYGDDDADLTLDVAYTIAYGNGTVHVDEGAEMRGTGTLPAAMFGDFSDYDPLFDDMIATDPSLPDWVDVQQMLEGFGVFIPEDVYNDMTGMLVSLYSTLKDGDNLDFYYIYGDSRYNTSMEDAVDNAVSDIWFEKTQMWADVEGDYVMEYLRNSSDGPYYITYFTGDPEDAPPRDRRR